VVRRDLTVSLICGGEDVQARRVIGRTTSPFERSQTMGWLFFFFLMNGASLLFAVLDKSGSIWFSIADRISRTLRKG
jgi:hypothetical protein